MPPNGNTNIITVNYTYLSKILSMRRPPVDRSRTGS